MASLTVRNAVQTLALGSALTFVTSAAGVGLSSAHPAAPAANNEITSASGAIQPVARGRETGPGAGGTAGKFAGWGVGSDMAQMLRVGLCEREK